MRSSKHFLKINLHYEKLRTLIGVISQPKCTENRRSNKMALFFMIKPVNMLSSRILDGIHCIKLAQKRKS